MKKGLLVAALCLLINSSYADDDFMEFGQSDFKSENYQQSSWNFSIGYGYLEWNRAMPEYDGSFDDVEDEEKAYLSGVLIDFGRAFYIGSSFSANLKLGVGYYVETEDITQQANEDLDLDLAEMESKQELFTGEVALALGYLFDTKYMGIQPFVEAAFGSGQTRVDRDYKYDGLTGSTDVPNPEKYKVTAEETFVYTKASLGVTFIGWKGITSYIKVTAMTVNKLEREFEGTSKTQTGSEISRDEKDDELDDLNTLITGSVGFGYLF